MEAWQSLVPVQFTEFEAEVRALVGKALADFGDHAIDVEVSLPPNPSYGDLSTPAPLRLAKATGLKPADAALKLADKVMAMSGSYRYVGAVTPHQGGYLNFSLNYPRFAYDAINGIGSAETIGDLKTGKGRRVAVEHTNVNPNKALHIGHARNLVLGDSLARILRHLDYDVQVLNYIDDSGAQVADVIVGFKFLGISDSPPEGTKFDSYCGDSVYVKVNEEYARDPKLKEKQSLVLKEIEKGGGEIAEYARKIVDRILSAQLETCWRLGSTYDLLNWESQLVHSGMWSDLFERMKEKHMVKLETKGENKGCWVIEDPDTREQKVVVRSDGTIVYVAKDIPYAAWKIGLVPNPFGFRVYEHAQRGGKPLYTTTLDKGGEGVSFGSVDFAVSVIDARQNYLQRIVSRVLEGLEEGSAKRYLHRAYEVVALSRKAAKSLGFEIEGEFAHMSGRKGLYVNVDKVLSAMAAKAVEETRKRNPTEREEWVAAVAEAVAVSALRYELVKQDHDKMIVFDIEESLKYEGDTGPYLLYTFARAQRILAKTEGKPELTPDSAAKLTRQQERALVKKMAMLDKAFFMADEYLSPREMAKFAHELAVCFNEFYERVPVNKEGDGALRNARLAMVDASSRVLAHAMDLIGLPHPDRI
jgi:arginyl-tRNA synthetase